MTSKIYRTAQGKSIDLGTIMLQNSHVRAVGNMNVNARGDKLDQNNRVVETKAQQIKRQNALTTNVTADPVNTSIHSARKNKKIKNSEEQSEISAPAMVIEPEPTIVTAPPVQNLAEPGKIPPGGLAAAIARQREVKQELEKTRRQQQQSQGVRKI